MKIQIIEILDKVVEVDTDSFEDALAQVKEQYANGDIILDGDCNVNTKFKRF